MATNGPCLLELLQFFGIQWLQETDKMLMDACISRYLPLIVVCDVNLVGVFVPSGIGDCVTSRVLDSYLGNILWQIHPYVELCGSTPANIDLIPGPFLFWCEITRTKAF